MGVFQPGRCLAGSVVVLALVGTACADAADPADGEDAGLFEEREASGSADGASAHAVLASRDVITALSDERAVAAVGILGVETVETRVADNTEGRRLTDEAIAGFRSTVAGLADDVASPDRSALDDAAAGLGTLRGEIDGHPGPASISEIGYADGVFDRYGDVIGQLTEAGRTAGLSISAPDLRQGIALFTLGLEQSELTGRAVRAVLLGTVSGGLDTPDEIAEVAALQAALMEGQATVTATAAGSEFVAAADQLEADLEAAGFLETLSSVLETGQADVAAVLDSVNVEPGQGWPAFLDGVEDILDDRLA
jgi:hypothetical protein